MRFLVLAVVVLCACEKHQEPARAAISDAEATDFATRLSAAMMPCDVEKVAALVDADAFVTRMEPGAKAAATKVGLAHYKDPHAVGRILCGWQKDAEAYRLLHVGHRDGQPAPIMRRLARAPRKQIVAAGYDQALLEKRGNELKLVDVYSYTQGELLSGLLVEGMESMTEEGLDVTLDASAAIKKSHALQAEGKFAEALAVIDALPPRVRASRMVQMSRVRVADHVSEDAHKQALDELARAFPNDPSVAMIEIDGAFLRHDYTMALADIDLIDAAVGGDAFQDAVRANVYMQRAEPGDLERAAAAADRAIATEPGLAKGWWARFEVAVKRRDFKLAAATTTHLRETFGATIDEATLGKLPDYAAFLASDDYKAIAAK